MTRGGPQLGADHRIRWAPIARRNTARFGVSPAVVRQRLKLAHVSPKLRSLYRKGEMGLEHVMALAISDDHAAQEAAWAALPDWNRDPAMLKRALTRDTVTMTDRLAIFVGVEAYVAAGGTILRDLFGAEDAGYLSDSALLTRLATAKMEDAAAALQAEGWKWVRPELTRDYDTPYGRVHPHRCENDDSAEDEAEPAFTLADRARAGARLVLGPDGTLYIERGLIHPDDVKAEAKAERGARTPAGHAGLSAALVEDLTAHRTAALRVELARSPAIALAALAHALALPLLYGPAAASCLELQASSETLERHTQALGDSAAHRAMAEERERWGDHLPGEASDLFAWCLAQPQDRLIDLLAYLTALTVDAVQAKQGRIDRHAHADQLAEALALDMRQWWHPSVEGFYQRLPKAALAQAVTEAKVPLLGDAIGGYAKAEAVRVAAGALAGTGWLPGPLKSQTPALVPAFAA